VTLEERFAILSADFVCAWQDLAALRGFAAEMNEHREKQAGRIEEARAIIVTLKGCCDVLDASLAERVDGWLKEV